MISLENVTKRYGTAQALAGISFEIKQGEIVGFLGPNGAGKTTTMKILTGFVAPTSGKVSVDGLDVLTDSLEIRSKIGYLPENAPVYQDMRVDEYLNFVGRIRGLRGALLEERRSEIVNLTGLKEVLTKDIAQLSKGFRQRVGLAQALIHDPSILILDEPTSGLDPNQIAEIRATIKRIGREKTILLSTHILSEVEAMTDRLLIISKGKIVADGTTKDLQSGAHRGAKFTVWLDAAGNADEGSIRQKLSGLDGVKGVTSLGRDTEGDFGFTVSAPSENERVVRARVFKLAVQESWVLQELRREDQRLEAVFQSLTRGEDS